MVETKSFNLKKFVEGKVKVKCKTETAAKNFFIFLISYNKMIHHQELNRWVSGREINPDDTKWDKYKEKTTYVFEPWSYGIAYGEDNGRNNPWIEEYYEW